MKIRCIASLICLVCMVLSSPAGGGEQRDGISDLRALVGRIQSKLDQGKQTEAELTAEIQEFDTLVSQHKEGSPEILAEIVLMKARLYLEVFGDRAKCMVILRQLSGTYPGTSAGKAAAETLESFQWQEEAARIRASLVEGAKFPDFDEKDLTGKPLSVGGLKAKVVLVDFWATWCSACLMELPNVLKLYEKYHAKGFDIIGVNLDQDQTRLQQFMKPRRIGWPQYFDGLGWKNKLSRRYGVQSLPSTYLLDADGKIIGRNLTGAALDLAISKALAGT